MHESSKTSCRRTSAALIAHCYGSWFIDSKSEANQPLASVAFRVLTKLAQPSEICEMHYLGVSKNYFPLQASLSISFLRILNGHSLSRAGVSDSVKAVT